MGEEANIIPQLVSIDLAAISRLSELSFGRYGMIGVCASDYFKSGGWNPAWGYHWGAEDVDLIHRLQNDLPYTVRLKESHYKHSHTGENRIYSKYGTKSCIESMLTAVFTF